eukprot:2774964-Rhodomonas_salina.2
MRKGKARQRWLAQHSNSFGRAARLLGAAWHAAKSKTTVHVHGTPRTEQEALDDSAVPGARYHHAQRKRVTRASAAWWRADQYCGVYASDTMLAVWCYAYTPYKEAVRKYLRLTPAPTV